MKKLLLMVSALPFLLTSCQTNNKPTVSEDAENVATLDSVYQKNLKEKPKMFLQFWYGMEKFEYEKVCNHLLTEGVLELGYYYKTGNCKSKLEPVYDQGKVIAINLVSSIECLYPLYVEKYGIPKMVQKTTVHRNFIEENPLYSPVTMFYDKGSLVQLPSCFIDNSSTVKGIRDIKPSSINALTASFLAKDEIFIDTETSVIKIEQKLIISDIPFYSYSLENTEAMRQYSRTPEGEKHLGMGGLMNDDSYFKYIQTNSKSRECLISKNPKFSITYYSKSEYYKNLQRISKEVTIKKDTLDIHKRVMKEI